MFEYADTFKFTIFSLRIQKFPRPHVRIQLKFACPHYQDFNIGSSADL